MLRDFLITIASVSVLLIVGGLIISFWKTRP